MIVSGGEDGMLSHGPGSDSMSAMRMWTNANMVARRRKYMERQGTR